MRIESRLRGAVRHFWETRADQKQRQGSESGLRDHGNRGAATGGKQLDGFVQLFADLLIESGMPEAHVHTQQSQTTLPGFFRPTKQWDLVVVHEGNLVATIEFKSQVGSFGNNYNNRIEEALGNALDLHTAYREGYFKPSASPWLGYLMMLQESPKSMRPITAKEPHFKVHEKFRGSSYVKRYEEFCTRLVRERLYNSACLVTSNRSQGLEGWYREPSEEISFQRFVGSLLGHVSGYLKVCR
ncbi:MAG: restriction endonuclease [Gammaproteobacteria bacterium]|nr:restriction endonuclease [Gammaproteobacteria bacterium]MYH47707.1 restriction endonuclease [Gammaproteobacteria bacterium]MYL14308.1 restriction endonuclease [Gammaproteobacteria bacterium]